MSLGVPTARRTPMMIRAAMIQVVRIEFEIGRPPRVNRSVADWLTPSELAKTRAGEKRPMRESERI
jgi:hypothetical protein